MTIVLSVKYSGMSGFTTTELETDTMTKTVTILDDKALDVRFAAGDNQSVSKNVFSEFPVEIEANTCDTSTNYNYTWELVSGPSRSIGSILDDSEGQSKLVVQQNQFNEYGTYIFQVNANNGSISGLKQLTLTVEKPALVAVITTPSGEHSILNPLRLDASTSYDPDDTSTVLSFVWSCTDANGASCVNQNGSELFDSSNASEAIQGILANTLIADTTYNFSVQVNDDTRTASQSVSVTTLSYDAPVLYVVSEVRRVTAQKPFRMQFQGEGSSLVSYAWAQTSGPIIDSSKILTPLTFPYISFEKNTFIEGADYTFTLSASYNLGTARAHVEFNINKGPKWGTFFIDKTSGVEYVDVFEMKALDWKDPEETDYPLKYGYKYTNADGLDVDLRKPSTDASFKTSLPNVSANNMTLKLCIFDSLEAHVESTKSVSVEKQDTATRTATVDTLINSLSRSQIDDRAAIINSLPTDMTLTDSQYSLVLESYQDWVLNNLDASVQTTSTLISMFQHITQYAQATNNTGTLLEAAKTICNLSTEGISRDQAAIILGSVEKISTNAIDIDTVISEVRQSMFSATLAEEESFDYQTDDLKGTFARTTPKRIEGQSYTPPGSTSSVTLPSQGLLEQIGKQDSDESTIIDTELKEYPKVTSTTGASSSVLDFKLLEVGTYTGSEISYHSEPKELEPQNLPEEITIEIEVENMPENFKPDCVYASAYDETTKTTTWSTEGVTVYEVRPTEGVVVCKSTHLSRFSANENLLPEPLPEITTILKKDESDDDKDSDIFPVMTAPVGLLVLIMALVAIRERKEKPEQIRQSEYEVERPLTQEDVHEKDNVVELQTELQTGVISTARGLDTARENAEILGNDLPVIDEVKTNKSVDESQKSHSSRAKHISRDSKDIPPEDARSVTEGQVPRGIVAHTSSGQTQGNDEMDARVLGLIPIKINTITLLSAHLIFGGCRTIPYSKTIRASVVCTALLGEIAFFGAGLLIYEGYDVFNSYDSDSPQPDYEVSREAVLAGVSVVVQLFISIILTFLYTRIPKAATLINILLIMIYSAGAVLMSVFFTTYWSMIWVVGAGVTTVLEILVAQTVLMFVSYCMSR